MTTNIVKRSRKLEDGRDVFEHNAWDDTEWTPEMHEGAERRLQEQRDTSIFYNDADAKQLAILEENVICKWDDFYQTHQDGFFKDRRWIFSEFSELLDSLNENSAVCNIFEVGCGVGNALAHLLENNSNKLMHIYCCDLSHNAIAILKRRDIYLANENQVTAFQADICKDQLSDIKAGSLDYIMLVFTMSAFKPELMRPTIEKLSSLLRPGGMILFRDYARYDLTQLRFKGSALLRDNYYIRSDGTTSYFFTLDEVHDIFTQEGKTMLNKVELVQDNRLLVNRAKGTKMSRCWIQAKYRKF